MNTIRLDAPRPAGRLLTTVAHRRAQLAAVAMVATLVALLALMRSVRIGEAMLSAALLRLMGTGADRVGTAILVDTDGARAGFAIASGCSTALLALPFIAVGALALVTGRVRPGRTLACVAVAVGGAVLLNQLRFGIVGGAIHLFGFERGYGQSHVLIGTLVSTVGMVAGLAGFVWALGRDPRATRG